MIHDRLMALTEAERIQIAAYRAMTPGRKLELAAGLRQFAWEVKASGLRKSNPGWPEAEIQSAVREIFRRAAA